MVNEAEKINKETGEQEKVYVSRSKAIEKIREKIIDLKGWNENEHSIYLSEFDKLQVKLPCFTLAYVELEKVQRRER